MFQFTTQRVICVHAQTKSTRVDVRASENDTRNPPVSGTAFHMPWVCKVFALGCERVINMGSMLYTPMRAFGFSDIESSCGWRFDWFPYLFRTAVGPR